MPADRTARTARPGRAAALSVLLVLGLTACASIRQVAVPVDSPLPADAAPPCRAGLQPGQACTAAVLAAQWQTPTGLQVAAGESYCVQVPPGQVWFDKHHRNIPPHGERGNVLMRLFSGLKRHPDSAWFSLMAAVVPPADASTTATSHQDLSRQPLLRIEQAGALVLYPNDAVGPPTNPTRFYANNAGQIWVTLRRCAEDCRCPAVPPA